MHWEAPYQYPYYKNVDDWYLSRKLRQERMEREREEELRRSIRMSPSNYSQLYPPPYLGTSYYSPQAISSYRYSPTKQQPRPQQQIPEYESQRKRLAATSGYTFSPRKSPRKIL